MMTPSPITIVDHLHSDVVLRERWGSGDIDNGHYLLTKRNSTPVGGGSFGALKLPSFNQVNSQQTHVVSTVGSLPVASEVNPLQHRRIDRTQSEPARPQIQPQILGNDGGKLGAATSSSRYKTELCRPFGETGFCKYGEKCQFAHGASELRNMPRHPKYKTELCRTFHTTGLCAYGTRCHFIHNADERRNPSGSDDEGCFGSKLGPSPPSSVDGSPTSQGGVFFDESFNIGSVSPPGHDDLCPFNIMNMETPPVSPVESLAGDLDSLSLSPVLSHSPSPPIPNPPLGGFLPGTPLMPHSSSTHMNCHGIRLPIFETLTEVL